MIVPRFNGGEARVREHHLGLSFPPLQKFHSYQGCFAFDLAKGEECVTELARPHAMSLAAVSKHLVVLEKAGLVKRRRDGRVHSLALEAKPMKEAQAWLERYRKFWEGNLDQFEKYLEKLQTDKTKKNDDEK